MSFILEAVRAQNQLPLLQGWETEHRDHVHPVLDVVLVDSGKYKKKKKKYTKAAYQDPRIYM